MRRSGRGHAPHPRLSTVRAERGGIASDHSAQEGAEGISCVGEDAGDVLPEDPSGRLSSSASNSVDCISKADELQGQVAAFVGQAAAQASHREGLAGRAADQHIRGRDLAGQDAGGNGGHVTQVRHALKAGGTHRVGEGLDVGRPKKIPAERRPGTFRRRDPRADCSNRQRHACVHITHMRYRQ